MIVLRALALLVVFLVPGCTSVVLDAQWAPLVRVEQDPTRLVAPGVVTTIFDAIYVRDLGAFDAVYPEGSVGRSALLTHEREHARRQAAAGVLWFARYLAEPSFRWAEEQIGWRLELEAKVAAGDPIDEASVADFLATQYDGMVSRADALAWVSSVVSSAGQR